MRAAAALLLAACEGPTAPPQVHSDEPGAVDTVETGPVPCDRTLDRDHDGASICDDCDDLDPDRSPDAAEVWYDGVDQDCDDGSDFDQDGDGADVQYHDGVWHGWDCDDTDPELNDHDADGDAFDTCTGDCDDLDPARHPEAYRECGDGLDSDCDRLNDCELAGRFTLPDPRHLQIAQDEVGSIGASGVEAGDHDGDGVDELFVGTGMVEGQVLVFETDIPTGSTEASASASLASHDWAVGDLTGDGLDDVASLHASWSGPTSVLVYAGPLVGPLDADDAVSRLEIGSSGGFGLSAGDVDADGTADLWAADEVAVLDFDDLGVPFRQGSVWLIHGPVPPAGGLELVDAVLYSDSSQTSPSPVPDGADLDGDGDDDMLISDTPLDLRANAEVYVIPGHAAQGTATIQSVGYRLYGEVHAGASACGDVNEDGYLDLKFGLAETGEAAVLFGPFTADREVHTTADITLVLPRGAPVAVGDINDDGYTDLATEGDDFSGDPFCITHGPIPTGVVDLEPLCDLTFDHAREGQPPARVRLGSPRAVGDMDLDGVDDFVLRATTNGDPFFEAIYLIFGSGPGW